MDSTDDSDMTLRETLWSYTPTGISPGICDAVLEEELDQ